MSNPDKHKPLNADELFKLLEEKNVDSSSLNDLDDFEREALEGFSAYSSVDRAKALTEQINAAVSAKVSEKKTKPASKVIWFSAAASVVLLIILSIYFLTETVTSTGSNLALNKEISNPQKQPPVPPVEQEQASAPDNSPVTAGPVQTKSTVSKVTVGNATAETLPEKTIDREAKPISPKDDYKAADKLEDIRQTYEKNAEPASGTVSQAPVVMDLALREEEKGGANNKKNNNADFKSAASETAKADMDETYSVNAAVGKTKQKESLKKESKDEEKSNGSYARSAPSVSGKVADSPGTKKAAYYNGGTKAVQDYIINRVQKNRNTAIPDKAVYTVTMTVFADGKVKVNTVTTLKAEHRQYTGLITEALNGMTWNPAVINNTPAESDLIIELKF